MRDKYSLGSLFDVDNCSKYCLKKKKKPIQSFSIYNMSHMPSYVVSYKVTKLCCELQSYFIHEWWEKQIHLKVWKDLASTIQLPKEAKKSFSLLKALMTTSKSPLRIMEERPISWVKAGALPAATASTSAIECGRGNLLD